MQRSNGYIIGFAAILTIVCGGLLAFANQGLKDSQDKAKQLDTRKQILSAVTSVEGIDINKVYSERVTPYVVDASGERDKYKDIDAEGVNTKKEYKKSEVSEKRFPVFEYKGENGELESYIIPVFGKGLWDDVWGYIALEKDMNTIKGVSFGHKGETPGLGARITEPEVQARFIGKKINDGGVMFIKGEGVPANITSADHQVDGLSGATMTTKGVNKMLDSYFGHYQAYFDKKR